MARATTATIKYTKCVINISLTLNDLGLEIEVDGLVDNVTDGLSDELNESE